ncbi:MAG: penicillin-binding protein [Bdellovibrionaceae bacterium]|nr:penicillin-binding protein [Pseudobdellovibrionaceae bacterium]
MRLRITPRYAIVGLILLFLCSLGVINAISGALETDEAQIETHLNTRTRVSQALAVPLNDMVFPEELQLALVNDQPQAYGVKYTIDEDLQNYTDQMLKRYRPDYAAVFMMDANTGEVLVYSSFQKSDEKLNLLRKATYPAASIFKIITATAAIDKYGLTPKHKIQFNGGNWSLYKSNVMKDKITRWTRTVTLREAFAKSMNTPFGKLGLNSVQPDDLSTYAEKFMFNQQIPTDFPVDPGTALVPTEKNFQLSEVASGYNRQNRMSPVQGAMIAAAVVNGGQMIAPYLVSELYDSTDKVVYQGQKIEIAQIMSEKSASKVRELMAATIKDGTSRKSFSHLLRDRKYQFLELGGKTGHLNGDEPRGQVDWFVGYASDGKKQIAIGAVIVNKKFWTVKSSYLSQTIIKKAFTEQTNVASK